LNIYDRKIGENPPRVDFFHGYPIHIDGLEHDAHGWPSFDAKTVDKMQKLRMQKIYQNLDEIIKYKEYFLDDAEILIFSFGISARSAMGAVKMAREQGIKAGLFQALTIWPFPRAALQERFKKTKKVLTVEMNMGQMKYEVERIAPHDVEKQTLLRANGMPFSPAEVLDAIKELAK
jgi:2-oxoglutarate ferredoxin oxidoreductase subunit alpha